MLPLVDLVFLTLGVIVAALTQMQHVTTLAVELAEVGPDAAEIRTDAIEVLALARDGTMSVGETVIDDSQLCEFVESASVVVRADRRLDVERLFEVLAELRRCGIGVSVEVDE
jgi:biopolymer transport protein ExbD